MTVSGERSLVSAAEEIGSNEDLVREILLRLPVNSLLRFKSVLKKWFSLISDPYFSHDYTLRRNPNLEPSGLLLDNEYAGLQFVPFNDDGDQAITLSCPNEPGISILQSCNGLLMCGSSICTSWKEKYQTFKRYICNPTTKQFTTICFPSPKFEAPEVYVNLAFDPLKSPYYKLVCVRMVVEEETLAYQIDIYSSETGSWRPPISADPLIFTSPDMYIAFKAPVYCWGAVHWYSDTEKSLYFDTDTECLKTMPMPPLLEGFDCHNVWYFGESRGHLHLIVINKPSALEFDILELETDYSGWFVRYRVNLDALAITFPESNSGFSILRVIRAEKENESTLVLFVSGKAISFNLHDKTSKKLCDLVSCDIDDEPQLDYEWSDAYQYIETIFYI